jgi:hypothetical protein
MPDKKDAVLLGGLLVPSTAAAIVAAMLSLQACALTCNATPDKLAHLRRDMSYAEATQVMGCPGSIVTRYGPDTGDYATVEWTGPGTLFERTRIDFLNGRLLSYITESRGAL